MRTIFWDYDTSSVALIEQSLLPDEFKVIKCSTIEELADDYNFTIKAALKIIHSSSKPSITVEEIGLILSIILSVVFLIAVIFHVIESQPRSK